MLSQRVRSCAIVTSQNYTRSKRNVFGHISGLEQATMMFFRHSFGDVCSREVLSIQRRVCAAVWAKVPPTNARNGCVNWRKLDDLTHRRPA
jgi:hypothetical protein